MTRHFTLRTMFRMTPGKLLGEFFAAIRHMPVGIDWQRWNKSDIDDLIAAIGAMSADAQGEIQATLADVFELACTSGVQTVLEVARGEDGDGVPEGFPAFADPYTQAMWTWLNCPQLFGRAAKMHQVEKMTHWRKRRGLPHIEPRTSPEALDKLAKAMSQFLRHLEGRGKNCTVEHFLRCDGTDYFAVYPDDFVRCVMQHDEYGQLVSRPVQRTFEIVFAYHRGDGTLELHARTMASDLKPRLERLFGEHILGTDREFSQQREAYDLNQLKDRSCVLRTDPKDHLAVTIPKMQLASPKRSRVTVEPPRDGRNGDIYDAIDDCLNREMFAWDRVDISMATLRFEFLATAGCLRAGSTDVTLTWPDRCTIRSRSPHRIDVIRKHLKLFRISHV